MLLYFQVCSAYPQHSGERYRTSCPLVYIVETLHHIQVEQAEASSLYEYYIIFADIAEYNQNSFKADTVYTYIEPRTYSNIFSVNQFQPTKGPSKDLVVPEAAGNIYEEIQKTNRRSDVMIPLAEVGGELKSFFQEKQRASVVGRPVPNVPGGGDSNATSDSSKEKKKQSPTPALPKRDPSTKVSSGAKVPPKPNPYLNEIPRGIVTFCRYILLFLLKRRVDFPK